MTVHTRNRNPRRTLFSAVLLAGCLVATAASAQTITLSGTTTALPFRDFATRELGDPWDMSQRTDLGWFTWGVDAPSSNLTSKGMATDAKGNTYFTSRAVSGSGDPNFWLLDTWNPGAAKIGKWGVNYPIDTTVYNALYVKMKFQSEATRSYLDTLLQGLPVAQVFWSRDTIYYSATSRPNGGFLRPVNASNQDVGIFLTPESTGPAGGVEGGNWVIYRIPLTVADMKANNAAVDHWQNVNTSGSSVNWGTAGVKADSLRIDPFQMPQLADKLGEIQVDWARLVSYSAGSSTTVSWTGGGTYDVVVSTLSDCSDFAVVAYSQSTGFQLQSQFLTPGTYYVGLRAPFTRNGHTGSASTVVTCSAGRPVPTFTVQSYPSLSLTSPNAEGSTDDFATTFLNNAWDFDSPYDIDFSRNVTTPDANYGIVSKAATDPAGNSLGTVRVFRNRSTTGTASGGDPHIYPLWPISSQAGARARGLNNHVDASRYRILTAEVGVERTRDVTNGSVARIVWHVAGDRKPDLTYAEIESADIVLRHLDPATENSGRIVLDTIQADMADRTMLAIESDIAQSASGWSNTCVASSVSNCTTSGAYTPGVDLYRLDFHEFTAPTDSAVRRIKLAALERTGSSFQIAWTGSNPSGLTSTVTLKAVPITSAAAGNYQPVDPACSTANAITIVSGLPHGAFSYSWTPGTTAGVTNGSEYYVCAQVFVSGVGSAVDEVMSKWPVVVDTGYTGAKPTFQFDRAALHFAGIRTPGSSPVFSDKTPDQTVRFDQSGSGTVNWTVSVRDINGAAVTWLDVSPASGTGSGSLVIGLKEDATLPACTVVDGMVATIKISSDELGNSPQYIQALLTIYPGAGSLPGGGCPHPVGVTSAPFGQVDTPVQNATGVQGAIGVTGWVLDDLGVSSVRIFRNCLAIDNPLACQVINGANVVYVGDAAFLAGARPDVEEAFPTHPLAYRAGWGYLMLTNMLPDVTNGLAFGGQGALTLYAFATDEDGKTTTLGRTQTDATPTRVTMANASIAKPFGAIDTPGQGQTVSGWLPNFGWALTPDSDTVAGGGDILIPTNGSTMVVFIDGIATATVAYNQCRGDVGNPVPAGLYCNDDVANVFGNAAPQPPSTSRLANPTKYRNLDPERAAIGAYDINTTTLSNGLHTIAWSVTDSAARTEGIGSRFFNVFNGSGDNLQALLDAPARVVGDAADAAALPFDRGAVWGRTSFDLRAAWEVVAPGSSGVRDVRIPELGRVDLFVGARTRSGYLVANGTLRPLPPGSQIRDGHFTWAPGAGYVGDYRLVFVSDDGQVPVTVKIHPASEAGRIDASIDAPRNGAVVRGRFRVEGWAVDSLAWAGSGIGAVHVWAHPRKTAASVVVTPGTVTEPVFLGAAGVRGIRRDVGAAVGAQFEASGWSLLAKALPPGTYDIVAYFRSTRTDRFEDARTVRVRVK